MEEKPLQSSFWNILIASSSIIPFILIFIPEVDSYWKTIILLISPAILCLLCFYFFLKQNDEILKKTTELEEKLKRSEGLVDILADIKYLKNKVK